MAIFGWLQKWLNVFFVWLGSTATEDSTWDDLSTQLNLLNDQLTQQSYATDYDFNIKPLPINSHILFPKHLWIKGDSSLSKTFCSYKHSVIDGILYCPNQYGRNFIFVTEDLVNFREVDYRVDGYAGYYLGNLAIKRLNSDVRVIKHGDWYYDHIGRYSYIDGERTIEEYEDVYDVRRGYCYCQTLYGGARIQLLKGRYNLIDSTDDSPAIYSDIFINGEQYDLNIPTTPLANYKGSIATYYNSLPSMSLAVTDTLYSKYDLAAGVYLYVMNGDVLYQYNSDFEMINIYHIPFPNFGMIYINGSLHFLVKTGVVKCNLS